MGMTEDFEASLQVIRGFDTDISIEVNEIKVLKRTFTNLLLTPKPNLCHLNLTQLICVHKLFWWLVQGFTSCASFSKLPCLMDLLYTEVCSVFNQKNNNSICWSKAKKILVSFDGKLFYFVSSDLVFYCCFLCPLNYWEPSTLIWIYIFQVGIGLLVLQQLSGINGVLFYSSTIFKSAG